jgi:hypothetical protein
MLLQLNRLPAIHICFEGRRFDVPLVELGLGETSGDTDIRRAIARHLEVPAFRVRYHVIDRHDHGDITIRPEEGFG